MRVCKTKLRRNLFPSLISPPKSDQRQIRRVAPISFSVCVWTDDLATFSLVKCGCQLNDEVYCSRRRSLAYRRIETAVMFSLHLNNFIKKPSLDLSGRRPFSRVGICVSRIFIWSSLLWSASRHLVPCPTPEFSSWLPVRRHVRDGERNFSLISALRVFTSSASSERPNLNDMMEVS